MHGQAWPGLGSGCLTIWWLPQVDSLQYYFSDTLRPLNHTE